MVAAGGFDPGSKPKLPAGSGGCWAGCSASTNTSSRVSASRPRSEEDPVTDEVTSPCVSQISLVDGATQRNDRAGESPPARDNVAGSVRNRPLWNDPARPIEIAWLAIDDVEPAPRRARRALAKQTEAVRRAIARFGFRIPLLVDGSGRIID